MITINSLTNNANSIPGNDDSGAMASLLVFHLLGLYPVSASKQFLIGSPFVSSFTLTNDFFGTTTKFTVNGFDGTTITANPPNGSRLFVKNVLINGVQSESLCVIDFGDVVGGGEIVIEVDADAEGAQARGCGPAGVPDSLETGGFSA
jgi:putative alpha-1,2-mannosidase